MTEDEFYRFLDGAIADLQHKQSLLQTQYRMGSQARWWFDQAAGRLKFYDDPQQAIDLEAQVVVLGTFDPEAHTWKWGWANSTLSDTQRAATQSLANLAEETGIEQFADAEAFVIEPGMDWEFAAMAVARLGYLGVYRAHSAVSKHQTFLGIEKILQSAQPAAGN